MTLKTLTALPHFSLNWKRWLAITGPGTLVSVGYIDPGNWATDLAGGSRAGYALLFIVLLSSLIAMLLQVMSARLGIATGRNLAQMSREAWPRLALPAWILAELAIIATDLAEVLGSALALNLLFGVPLLIGVVLTTLDVLLILTLDRRGSKALERIVASLIFIIACGFGYELALSRPAIAEVLQGYLPTTQLITDSQLLYLAIGVIGATVMPHNLYLHSNLVLKHKINTNQKKAASFAALDTIISLSIAMLLNSALVILAASIFHHAGYFDVTEITSAYHLLTPLVGSGTAALVFGVALLASGQSATITGTMAGQVVMQGFLRLQMKPWLRRLVTRAIVLIPVLVAFSCFGEGCTANLLIGSQVFLSLQLPFAMIPLLILTSDSNRMGSLINNVWIRCLGWCSTSIILIAIATLMVKLID
jgi:manganese transport protein